MESASKHINAVSPNALSFETAEGRKTDLNIISRETISSGVAEVQRVKVNFSGENTNNKQGDFILKNFKNVILAENSLAVHQKLKGARITTWPTYRIESGQRKSILMTDGELEDNEKVITSNNLSQSMIQIAGAIDSIPNIESALDSAIRDAILAGQNGIEIGSDAWMGKFKIDPTNGTAIAKFFIGDLEGVSDTLNKKGQPLESGVTTKLSQLNVLTLEKALKDMIQWSVSGKSLPQYQEILKKAARVASSS